MKRDKLIKSTESFLQGHIDKHIANIEWKYNDNVSQMYFERKYVHDDYVSEEYWLYSFFNKQYHEKYWYDDGTINFITYFSNDTYTEIIYIEFFESDTPKELQKFRNNELVHSFEYVHNYDYEMRFLIMDNKKYYFLNDIDGMDSSYEWDDFENQYVGFRTDPEKLIKQITEYFIFKYEEKKTYLYRDNRLVAIGYFNTVQDSPFATNYIKIVFMKDKQIIAMKNNIKHYYFFDDKNFYIDNLFDINDKNGCSYTKYNNRSETDYIIYQWNHSFNLYKQDYYNSNKLISTEYCTILNEIMMSHNSNKNDNLTQIFIRNPKNKKLISLRINLNLVTTSFYNLIESFFNINYKICMKLYYNNKLLNASHTKLKDYNIQNFSTIRMKLQSDIKPG